MTGKGQITVTHINGFLIVREQVIEPIEVSFLLPERQLQLVYLVVFLLDGGKLLIQRLLWEKQVKNVRLKGESPWLEEDYTEETSTSRAFSFSFSLCRSFESTLSFPPGLLLCSKSPTMFMYSWWTQRKTL